MPIRLKLLQPFGPFTEMADVELPDFAVLTGLNGSGKTQLLRAIELGSVEATVDGARIDPKQLLYVAQLQPKLNLTYLVGAAQQEEQRLTQKLLRLREDELPKKQPRIGKRPPDPYLTTIGAILGKPPATLLTEEVEALAVAVAAEGKTAHFGTDLAHVSMGHLRKYYHWIRASMANGVGDNSLDHLRDAIGDLRTRPTPWDLVTQVLQPFGFRIQGPELSVAAAQANLNLTLKNASGADVSPEQLSGGEQSLLALAIAQYATSLVTNGFPRLLLLDESLSSLHPAIIRRALNTIREVFVLGNEIRVILVTHAATLVALAPQGSVFEVRNELPRVSVRPASIDVGIGLLTAGVPTMRFDPANRRQIFVEANQDEFVYQRAYQSLRPHLDPEVSLEFLSCFRQSSNSSAVIDLVPRMRSGGVKSAHGLVDWDGEGNRPLPDGVLALAAGERYAIENVFLDPLLLAFLFSRSADGRAELGIQSARDIEQLDESGVQQLVDKIVARIETNLPTGKTFDKDPMTVGYVEGHRLQLPKWVLLTQGHEYAEYVITSFPFLRQYRAGPNNSAADRLIAAIAADHLVDASRYTPSCLLAVFKDLQARSIL